MTKRTDSLERGERAARVEFLVSFLVDARGGTMTASRKGGYTSTRRLVIPRGGTMTTSKKGGFHQPV